jgi:hypothetical protein
MLSSRFNLGYQHTTRRSYIYEKPKINFNIDNNISKDYVIEGEDDMSGEGIIDLAKAGYEKAKSLGKKVAGFYGSETGKKLINMLPDSDDTARAGYAGEQHAILQLPNGKYGVGNYIGPGTQVIKRVARGDPGRTPVDVASMRHDIDYTIGATKKTKSEQLKAGREADIRMVKTIKKIEANKTDNKKNILMGKAIMAKMKAEDLGILDRTKFLGDLENLSDKDMILLKSKRAELSQAGYGHPGEKLKHALMMKYKGKGIGASTGYSGSGTSLAGKKGGGTSLAGHSGGGKKGKGTSLAGHSGGGKKGKGTSLAGHSGGGKMDNLVGFIKNGLIPNMVKDLGINRTIPTDNIIKILKSKNLKNVTDISSLLTKLLMPLLVKDKVEQTGSGAEMVKENVAKAKAIVKKVQPKLFLQLQTGIQKALEMYFNQKQSGGGINISGGSWASFWSGFKATLRVVGKLALKFGAHVAEATGHPILATALGAIDSQIGWVKP